MTHPALKKSAKRWWHKLRRGSGSDGVATETIALRELLTVGFIGAAIIGGAFIVLGEILAAQGYIPPIIAAVLHLVSGLVVIFNSARLVGAGEEIEMAEAAATVKPRRVSAATSPKPAVALG